MDKFWSLFWKFFGIALGAAFAVSIILGMVWHSPDVTYSIIQKIIAVGMGVCGVIGMIIVPIELYFIDRATCMQNISPLGGDGYRDLTSGGDHGLG
jgi:hypothetical protein